MKTSNKIFVGLLMLFALNVLTGMMILRGSLQPHGIGDGEKVIEGAGTLKTKELIATNFSKLQIDGNYEVTLSQGEEFIRIEAEENLIDYFITEKTAEGRLILTAKEEFTLLPNQTVKVKLGFNALTEIEIGGATTITASDTLQFEHLQLNMQDVCKADLRLVVKDNINIWMKDMTKANLTGSATKTRIELSDMCELRATDLIFQKVKIQTRDMSFADLNVVQKFDAQSGDNSTIEYKGQPTLRIQDRDMSRILSK